MLLCGLVLYPHPAWPLVDSALLVIKRRSSPPDGLLTFVPPLCRPIGDPKLAGQHGFRCRKCQGVVHFVLLLSGLCPSWLVG